MEKEKMQYEEADRYPVDNGMDGEEIDLLELARKLWDARKMILRWCGIGALVGLIVAFSIPKEYAVTVKLAPELSGGDKKGGGLSDLASQVGINLSSGSTVDAVYPMLYPDIVSSIPFATELFDVEVADRKGKLQTTVYDYLSDHTRSPWWSAVISFPFKALGWVMSIFRGEEPVASEEGVNPFRLTKEEAGVVTALSERVVCDVDKKTSVITLTVTMQDPLIAATLTDTVMMHLQEYITRYRTDKARRDLEFTQKLFDESQRDYYDAQSKYARYMDANQNIALRSGRTEEERLQNEMSLAYNLYSQMAKQLQAAKAKVQESTPVYAVLQPATVPQKAAKPSKSMILVGFVFLAGVAASAWVLFGRDLLAQFRKKEEEEA